MNNHTERKKYEYNLPNDGERLVIDIVSYGSLDATKDGISLISQESIVEKAKALIEQLKLKSTAEHITNDIDMFQEVVNDAYTIAYMDKQKAFRQNKAMHVQEVRQIERWGGYKKAFTIVRERVVCGMYRK